MEVGPMEDAVREFIDTLVETLLPCRISDVPPTQDSQNAIAKQMHAVVLLYNYYHRKQEPELVFLDLANFCKLAVMMKPALTEYMKSLMACESVGLHCVDHRLSVTEKAIKNACDIAMPLDASRDVPDMKEWPISKIAVLLIDSDKYCWLQFGSVTQGVWSPIEKAFNESSLNLEMSAQQKNGIKRKVNSQEAPTDDIVSLLLAFDAVKDATGIDSSDLEVLETGAAYSLSEAKSATLFYMMQYRGSFSMRRKVPLKFIVESLQGPLAKKTSIVCWGSATVVEYYHMLPYKEFMSSWISGEDVCSSNLNGCNAQSTNACKMECSLSRALNLCTSNLCTSKCDGNKSDHIDCSNSGERSKKSKLSLGGGVTSPIETFQSRTKDGTVAKNKFNNKYYSLYSPKNSSCQTAEYSANDSGKIDKSSQSHPSRDASVKNNNGMEKMGMVLDSRCDDPQDGLLSGLSRGFAGEGAVDDNTVEKFNHNVKRKITEILGQESEEFSHKGQLSCHSAECQMKNTSANAWSNNQDTSKKVDSEIKASHNGTKNNSCSLKDGAHTEEDGLYWKLINNSGRPH